MTDKTKTIIKVIAGVLIAALTALLSGLGLTSCNVTRKVTTESSYFQRGDTTIQIVTRTTESYDATKKTLTTMTKKITRSTVNEQQYSAPEFPKSGFPLSYRRYSSYMLGRIHVAGFHWTMPGDKISGKTSGKGTFHRMVTPIVSPVNAMQYNVFLPLRPLDRSFKKGMTPTKLNSMSANWTMPLFNTRYLVDQILRAYFNISSQAENVGNIPIINDLFEILYTAQINPNKTLAQVFTQATLVGSYQSVNDFLYGSSGLVSSIVKNLTTDGTRLTQMADALYMRDALLDIVESITAKLGSNDNPISDSILAQDFMNLYFSTILTPWVGRYSYYGELKYKFLRPFDFYRISRGMIYQGSGYEDFLNAISDTPQNEYAIRAMYAVWYELFRNVDLEPVSATLPDWQEWSSTSIFDMSAGGNLCYLLYRIRSWEKDMFVSAQIDDISRHVYAPIVSEHNSNASYHTDTQNNLDTQQDGSPTTEDSTRTPTGYMLGYRDQLYGESASIWCPVPANVNDILSALDKEFVDIYGLDLNTLRQSQMLERYLKRNYLFGDEYQDRMLAHYNSRVSDMRINKPEILSQSMDGYDMGQEVSNVSTDETKVGDRTATATIDVNGEQYTTFCEEFGIVLSLVCYMPRAMYDGICPQNLLAKQVDMPLPEFAGNNEEFGRKLEIADSGLTTGYDGDSQNNNFMFGRYPAYHAWRSRVDEVGGEFLDELQDSTFRRFFGMFSDDTTPKLNYFFIHCRPNLNMFANNVRYDTQLYADLVHECFVERVLPVPVETI